MLEVTAAKGIRLARVDELLTRVLADRLEHRVPRRPASVLHHHERLVDEVCEKLEDGLAFNSIAAADGLGCLERAATDKDGQPAKEEALAFGEEVIAPVDEPAKRLLARDGVSAAAGEEAEPVIEPFGDLGDRENSYAGGRELERQRDAVQAAADSYHVGRVLFGKRELRLKRRAPRDEQADGFVLTQLVKRRESLAERQPERGHRHERLARDVQALTTRRDDRHVGA